MYAIHSKVQYVVCLVLCHVHVYSLCVYGYMYCAVSDYLPTGRYIHALQCRGFTGQYCHHFIAILCVEHVQEQ